jgi:hypothetical protein
MPTSQDILTDIDLRYRNSFTQAQKLVWFNEEQRELFDMLEIDSAPYSFSTVLNQNSYPFPDQFDVTKIKTVSYQIDDTNFQEIDFKRNDDNQDAGYGLIWYTIVSNLFFLYVPDSVPAGRTVYIYCDSDPTDVTTTNVGNAPDLPTKYQEILKYGVLKRIAEARKDTLMRNNFDANYQEKIADLIWERKLKEPEFSSAVDVLPGNDRYRVGRYDYRYFNS